MRRWIVSRGYRFPPVSIKNARAQVLENASIMITAANAIRDYTATDLVPLLPLEHRRKICLGAGAGLRGTAEFQGRAGPFPGFSYREPALNPTNLSDRAQDWEADIINLFRNETERQEFVSERETPWGRNLSISRGR